jgi:aspartyl-tRNA(Asn)/glutamyl-tRNA(Gln) amidotransferase subunit C
MTITPKEIENIAHLARIQINEYDTTIYTKNLNNIMGLVDQMNGVDTRDVKPMSHSFDETQRLREDEVTRGNRRDQLLGIAPSTEFGLYLVPQVID